MKKLLILFGLVSMLGMETKAQNFQNSHLPIVVITTNDEIPDEPKIQGMMGIIDNGPGVMNSINDPFNHYNGNIGIETRGNSTQGYDKKTYSIELWDDNGADISSPLLGMGKEEDWILHAMVIDKTQLRIPLSFDLFRSMGHYASHWRFVEVVLNGDYRGLYLLCEKIKRDDDRVDIAKLDSDDIQGDSLTGGYILRIDWLDEFEGFQSQFNSQGGIPQPYHWYYPKASKIKPEQASYIENYMNLFESALYAPDFHNSQGVRYSDYINMTSFADFLLINELTKNSDGYKLSSYIHKDRDDKDGRLTAGPIWDFDQTYGLSTVCSSHVTEGWTYMQNQDGCEDLETMPMWWQRLMEDPIFTHHLKCRWETMRQSTFHQDSLYAWLDEHTAFLQNPLERNFQRWDFIGESIWIEPEPIPQTYEAEITYMKNWIAARLTWLDANMPGNCEDDIISSNSDLIQHSIVRMYPNPARTEMYLESTEAAVYTVYDAMGKVMFQGTLNQSGIERIDCGNWASGIYFVDLNMGQHNEILKWVKL